jgi:septal ring factor EnvC (AmiA/AmiB activator)
MLNHGGGLLSVYAGCSELLVKDGQAVVRGQAIARAGSGLGTQGPGVQFRVYRSGEPTDPLPLLP